jgi:hypothetical protein
MERFLGVASRNSLFHHTQLIIYISFIAITT